MSLKRYIFVTLTICCISVKLLANELFQDIALLHTVPNSQDTYTLINSVDFHPFKNLFCATYSQHHKVILYEIDPSNHMTLFQELVNPEARLNGPQHALFSRDGEKIYVINWADWTFTVYRLDDNNRYQQAPVAKIMPDKKLEIYRPHGVAFSPNEDLLAVAYGHLNTNPHALVLFEVKEDQERNIEIKLVSLIDDMTLPGVPKGVTFSPDGNTLLVTFSDIHALAVYAIDPQSKTLVSTPRQLIQGPETQIFRPEDVKMLPGGDYCAISNSDMHNLAFYSFDQKSNTITQNTPCFVLQNPDAQLCFPHGIAFSSVSPYLVISQFGPILTTEEGDIDGRNLKASDSNVALYKIIPKKNTWQWFFDHIPVFTSRLQ